MNISVWWMIAGMLGAGTAAFVLTRAAWAQPVKFVVRPPIKGPTDRVEQKAQLALAGKKQSCKLKAQSEHSSSFAGTPVAPFLLALSERDAWGLTPFLAPRGV